jgi:hypothetical protein
MSRQPFNSQFSINVIIPTERSRSWFEDSRSDTSSARLQDPSRQDAKRLSRADTRSSHACARSGQAAPSTSRFRERIGSVARSLRRTSLTWDKPVQLRNGAGWVIRATATTGGVWRRDSELSNIRRLRCSKRNGSSSRSGTFAPRASASALTLTEFLPGAHVQPVLAPGGARPAPSRKAPQRSTNRPPDKSINELAAVAASLRPPGRRSRGGESRPSPRRDVAQIAGDRRLAWPEVRKRRQGDLRERAIRRVRQVEPELRGATSFGVSRGRLGCCSAALLFRASAHRGARPRSRCRPCRRGRSPARSPRTPWWWHE